MRALEDSQQPNAACSQPCTEWRGPRLPPSRGPWCGLNFEPPVKLWTSFTTTLRRRTTLEPSSNLPKHAEDTCLGRPEA